MGIENDRFDGVRKLVGDERLAKIKSASVCVIGVGGVGSWSIEALARSGVGQLTLVDLDDICITNVNRQIHALEDTIGLSKVSVLKERIKLINPECEVNAIEKFYTEKTSAEVLAGPHSVVLDAIDRVTNKTLLIAACVKKGIPIVSTGSAGDRTDPTLIRVADLSMTIHDPLLSYVRKRLRQKFDFPRGDREKFNVQCVYAPLQRNDAAPVCSNEGEDGSDRRSCNSGLGTAVFVTGSLGFFAASEVIKIIIAES